jgi:hypothetical protein
VEGTLGDDLDADVHASWLRVPDDAGREYPPLTPDEVEIRRRISDLVEAVKDDRVRSSELFHYVWTMICVRRGLMRVVREVQTSGGHQLVVEEVKTGQHRLVPRPRELDRDIEGLAVQALSRILADRKKAV